MNKTLKGWPFGQLGEVEPLEGGSGFGPGDPD